MSTGRPRAVDSHDADVPRPDDVVTRAMAAGGCEFNLRRRVRATLSNLRALGQDHPLDDVDRRCVVMAFQLACLRPRLSLLTRATEPPLELTDSV